MPKYVNEANLQRFWDNIKDRIGNASQEQVDAWLDNHPEATTTVQDGAVTTAKLADGAVTDAKLSSDTSEKVYDSIDRLNDLSYELENNSLPVSWFERGGLTNGENDGYRQGTRVHTVKVLSFDTPAIFTVTSGQYGFAYFNANDTYSSWSGWKTSADTVFIPAGQKFRLMLTTNNTATESQTDSLETIVGAAVLKVDGTHKCTLKRYGLTFEHGGIDASGADDDTWRPETRIRSIGITSLPYSVNVSMETGSYIVEFYNQDDSFAYSTTWATTAKRLVPAGQKFRLLLMLNPTDTAAVDLQTLIDFLAVESIGVFNTYSATPNIIFACRSVDETHIPPESKWAVQAAAMNQYDRLRFTVRRTTDGQYINCHDDFINNVARNPDGSAISERVYVAGKTLAELNQYDWGIQYGARYAGATVPLLDDTLKWSALFNLGVTLHCTGTTESDVAFNDIVAMFDKYGLTDNMMVITSSGRNLTLMAKFVAHNPRVSCFVGATTDWWTSENIAAIKELQTSYNKIYVQPYPWASVPSQDFMSMANSNNFILMNTSVMSMSDLLNVDTFNHGYRYIEAQGIYAIKDTVREWANGLIDA